jgi:ATP-dependent helicase HrpB
MKQYEKLPLPIDSFIPSILDILVKNETVLVKASPGSGKTTRLPWAIANALRARVLVLEPRRLAAKLAAQRIAQEENLTIGDEIGYHFRFERKLSEKTRVCFYTEGTFLKLIQKSESIIDDDIIILDEFHERHLETDLAFALLRGLARKKKIKIILMSATLDINLAKALGTPAIIEIDVPHFPVTIQYLPNLPSILNQPLEVKIKRGLEETTGDTLVFLPGMREILQAQRALDEYQTYILHGELDKEDQEEALRSYPFRKIILSTNIAESSVTIPGITTVIDSGVQRNAHFSSWSGLKILKDTPTTKSSAIQRAGRAGRTGPGRCLRLYAEMDFNERETHVPPELFRAELLEIFLQVSASSIEPLWFQPPPTDKWEKAREFLTNIGAINQGGVTSIGKDMLEIPLGARLARTIVSADNSTKQEKEKLINYICQKIENDKSGHLKRRLMSQFGKSGSDASPWEKHLLSGFFDQVAKYRVKQKDFIHYSGKVLKAHQSLSNLQEGFYMIMDISQREEAIQIVGIEEEWLWELDPFPLKEEEEIKIEDTITFRRKTLLGSIVIEESIVKKTWSGLDKSQQKKISSASEARFKKELKQVENDESFQKIYFWASIKEKNVEDIISTHRVEDYFAWNEELSFGNIKNFFRWVLEKTLNFVEMEQSLPDTTKLAGTKLLKIHYPKNLDPYIEAPIQEFYGIKDTPTIMKGRILLQLKLVGPHKRPIQVTKDLKSFWEKTYQEIKKEYQRDYPKHYWPDHPSEAKPFLLKAHLTKA